MSLDPIPLLVKVYDYIILNCKMKNIDKATKGLVELISALNFDYQEVSLGLFRLYQFCLDSIKQNNFDDAIKILEGLRESWISTLDKKVPHAKKELSIKT
ncbi:flagellar protein FliS [candidate division KSB1 bacterium]